MAAKIGTSAPEVLDYLAGALSYDAATGTFVWTAPKAGQLRAGTPAGWRGAEGA